jgi:hypothetical protein
VWTGDIWLRTGASGGSCEHGKALSGNFLTKSVTITFSKKALLHGVKLVS